MISIKKRKQIVAARKEGRKIAEICEAYRVKRNAVFRLLRQERAIGSIEPQTQTRGRKPALTECQLSQMKMIILAENDITLQEIKERMGLGISISAIHRIIKNKLKFTYKKRVYMPASGIGRT